MTFTPWIEKKISLDFAQFNDELFAVAHVWILLISACLEVKFEAGMIKQISSANLQRELPGMTAGIDDIMLQVQC